MLNLTTLFPYVIDFTLFHPKCNTVNVFPVLLLDYLLWCRYMEIRLSVSLIDTYFNIWSVDQLQDSWL